MNHIRYIYDLIKAKMRGEKRLGRNVRGRIYDKKVKGKLHYIGNLFSKAKLKSVLDMEVRRSVGNTVSYIKSDKGVKATRATPTIVLDMKITRKNGEVEYITVKPKGVKKWLMFLRALAKR